jgi:ABC-type oligopeptide transport system substrate-binding subunit
MSWVADLPDPYTYLRSLVHSTGESNLFGYASAEADSLLDLGQRMPNGPQRSRTFLDLQEVILVDAPFVPLFHSSVAYSWRPEVRGLSIGPCGISVVDMTRVYLQEAEKEPLHGRVQ